MKTRRSSRFVVAFVLCASGAWCQTDRWMHEASLTALGPSEFAAFGFAAALDGEWAAVGAPLDDSACSWTWCDSGAVYLFRRVGSGWESWQKLVTSDLEAYDQLGGAVALDGDVAVVGARLDDDGGTNAGAAYVFERSGTTWSESAKLLGSGGACDEGFGHAVAPEGESAVIGMPQEDRVEWDSGSARCFTRAGTTWSEAQTLVPHLQELEDEIGQCVGISGDTILVGAWGADFDVGAVHVFRSQPPFAYVDTRRPLANAASYVASSARAGRRRWT